MKKKFLAYLCLCCLAIPALAGLAQAKDTYFIEVDAAYGNMKGTLDNDTLKSQIGILSAGFFFKPVSMASGPWEEAAFLQQASNVNIFGGFQSTKGDSYGAEYETDGPTFGISAEYIFSGIPIYLSPRYQRSSEKGEWGTSNVESTLDSFELRVGYYVLKNLLVGIRYEHSVLKTEVEGFDEAKETSNSYGFGAKYVHSINQSMSFNVEGYFSQNNYKQDDGYATEDGKNNVFELYADFYFTPQIGIGAGLMTNSGDDKNSEGNTYSFGVKGYITPNIGLSFAYEVFKPKDKDQAADSQTFVLGITGRF